MIEQSIKKIMSQNNISRLEAIASLNLGQRSEAAKRLLDKRLIRQVINKLSHHNLNHSNITLLNGIEVLKHTVLPTKCIEIFKENFDYIKNELK